LKTAHSSKDGVAKPPVYGETYDGGVANTILRTDSYLLSLVIRLSWRFNKSPQDLA
jgi:hypothetical protein